MTRRQSSTLPVVRARSFVLSCITMTVFLVDIVSMASCSLTMAGSGELDPAPRHLPIKRCLSRSPQEMIQRLSASRTAVSGKKPQPAIVQHRRSNAITSSIKTQKPPSTQAVNGFFSPPVVIFDGSQRNHQSWLWEPTSHGHFRQKQAPKPLLLSRDGAVPNPSDYAGSSLASAPLMPSAHFMSAAQANPSELATRPALTPLSVIASAASINDNSTPHRSAQSTNHHPALYSGKTLLLFSSVYYSLYTWLNLCLISAFMIPLCIFAYSRLRTFLPQVCSHFGYRPNRKIGTKRSAHTGEQKSSIVRAQVGPKATAGVRDPSFLDGYRQHASFNHPEERRSSPDQRVEAKSSSPPVTRLLRRKGGNFERKTNKKSQRRRPEQSTGQSPKNLTRKAWASSDRSSLNTMSDIPRNDEKGKRVVIDSGSESADSTPSTDLWMTDADDEVRPSTDGASDSLSNSHLQIDAPQAPTSAADTEGIEQAQELSLAALTPSEILKPWRHGIFLHADTATVGQNQDQGHDSDRMVDDDEPEVGRHRLHSVDLSNATITAEEKAALIAPTVLPPLFDMDVAIRHSSSQSAGLQSESTEMYSLSFPPVELERFTSNETSHDLSRVTSTSPLLIQPIPLNEQVTEDILDTVTPCTAYQSDKSQVDSLPLASLHTSPSVTPLDTVDPFNVERCPVSFIQDGKPSDTSSKTMLKLDARSWSWSPLPNNAADRSRPTSTTLLSIHQSTGFAETIRSDHRNRRRPLDTRDCASSSYSASYDYGRIQDITLFPVYGDKPIQGARMRGTGSNSTAGLKTQQNVAKGIHQGQIKPPMIPAQSAVESLTGDVVPPRDPYSDWLAAHFPPAFIHALTHNLTAAPGFFAPLTAVDHFGIDVLDAVLAKETETRGVRKEEIQSENLPHFRMSSSSPALSQLLSFLEQKSKVRNEALLNRLFVTNPTLDPTAYRYLTTYSSCYQVYQSLASVPQSELIRRFAAINHLRRICNQYFKGVEFYAFGSIATGLVLPESDVDIGFRIVDADAFMRTWQSDKLSTTPKPDLSNQPTVEAFDQAVANAMMESMMATRMEPSQNPFDLQLTSVAENPLVSKALSEMILAKRSNESKTEADDAQEPLLSLASLSIPVPGSARLSDYTTDDLKKRVLYAIQRVIIDKLGGNPQTYDFLAVPLMKWKWQEVSLSLDISPLVESSLPNALLISEYLARDPRAAPLISIVKQWAKLRRINSARYGTVNSLGYCLMVIAYLKQCDIGLPGWLNYTRSLQNENKSAEEQKGYIPSVDTTCLIHRESADPTPTGRAHALHTYSHIYEIRRRRALRKYGIPSAPVQGVDKIREETERLSILKAENKYDFTLELNLSPKLCILVQAYQVFKRENEYAKRERTANLMSVPDDLSEATTPKLRASQANLHKLIEGFVMAVTALYDAKREVSNHRAKLESELSEIFEPHVSETLRSSIEQAFTQTVDDLANVLTDSEGPLSPSGQIATNLNTLLTLSKNATLPEQHLVADQNVENAAAPDQVKNETSIVQLDQSPTLLEDSEASSNSKVGLHELALIVPPFSQTMHRLSTSSALEINEFKLPTSHLPISASNDGLGKPNHGLRIGAPLLNTSRSEQLSPGLSPLTPMKRSAGYVEQGFASESNDAFNLPRPAELELLSQSPVNMSSSETWCPSPILPTPATKRTQSLFGVEAHARNPVPTPTSNQATSQSSTITPAPVRRSSRIQQQQLQKEQGDLLAEKPKLRGPFASPTLDISRTEGVSATATGLTPHVGRLQIGIDVGPVASALPTGPHFPGRLLDEWVAALSKLGHAANAVRTAMKQIEQAIETIDQEAQCGMDVLPDHESGQHESLTGKSEAARRGIHEEKLLQALFPLESLLRGFFRYFCRTFEPSKHAVAPFLNRPESIIARDRVFVRQHPRNPTPLVILNPFEVNENVARTCRPEGWEEINRECFAAFMALDEAHQRCMSFIRQSLETSRRNAEAQEQEDPMSPSEIRNICLTERIVVRACQRILERSAPDWYLATVHAEEELKVLEASIQREADEMKTRENDEASVAAEVIPPEVVLQAFTSRFAPQLNPRALVHGGLWEESLSPSQRNPSNLPATSSASGEFDDMRMAAVPRPGSVRQIDLRSILNEQALSKMSYFWHFALDRVLRPTQARSGEADEFDISGIPPPIAEPAPLGYVAAALGRRNAQLHSGPSVFGVHQHHLGEDWALGAPHYRIMPRTHTQIPARMPLQAPMPVSVAAVPVGMAPVPVPIPGQPVPFGVPGQVPGPFAGVYQTPIPIYPALQSPPAAAVPVSGPGMLVEGGPAAVSGSQSAHPRARQQPPPVHPAYAEFRRFGDSFLRRQQQQHQSLSQQQQQQQQPQPQQHNRRMTRRRDQTANISQP